MEGSGASVCKLVMVQAGWDVVFDVMDNTFLHPGFLAGDRLYCLSDHEYSSRLMWF